MILYLDASALVKLLVEEDGTDEALELWDDASVRLTSLLSYAECRAALAAAARSGRLSRAGARAARSLLDDHWGELTLVHVDDGLVRMAGELVEDHALRGYDAVHLASALAAGEGGAIVLGTWDRDLGVAALAAGLLVAPSIG